MKYHLIYCIIFLLSTYEAVAQKNINKDLKDITKDLQSLFSSDQQLIRLAVDSSICIIRQEYTVMDSSGQEFGANGYSYWGMKYCLGVITDKGLYTDSEILSPWNGDKDLESFLKTDKRNFKPHLSKRLYKRISDHEFIALATTTSSMQPDSSLIIIQNTGAVPAIPASLQLVDTTGWLVVASSKTKLETNSSEQINYSIIKLKVSPNDSTSKMYLKNATVPESSIGGIYFTRQVSLGKILFSAAGILKKDSKGWYVNTFASNPINQKSKPEKFTPTPILKGT